MKNRCQKDFKIGPHLKSGKNSKKLPTWAQHGVRNRAQEDRKRASKRCWKPRAGGAKILSWWGGSPPPSWAKLGPNTRLPNDAMGDPSRDQERHATPLKFQANLGSTRGFWWMPWGGSDGCHGGFWPMPSWDQKRHSTSLEIWAKLNVVFIPTWRPTWLPRSAAPLGFVVFDLERSSYVLAWFPEPILGFPTLFFSGLAALAGLWVDL